ncbi:MAG TPA: hypothetical protein VGE15_02255 [Sphingobacteriaceae bacterium]
MMILSADLPELYLFLNREFAAGKEWLVYNEVLVFQHKMTIRCFAGLPAAERFIAGRNKLTCRLKVANLRPLYHTVLGVLLQKVVPPFIDTQDYVNLLNYTIMNTKNAEYLKDSLRYLGFGSFLYEDLEKNIRSQASEFQLRTAIGHLGRRVDYTLYFRRSESMDMYFFNRYQATISGQDEGPDRSQTFYIHKGGGITAREAFNLLEGRSVYKLLLNKEGIRYNAWLKLDTGSLDQYGNARFRQFSDRYGYDLQKVLSIYPIREMKDPGDRKQLLNSLEKGNLQAVHFEQKDGAEKFYIYAQPQFKTIGLYDQKLRPVVGGRTPAAVSEDPLQAAAPESPSQEVSAGEEQKKSRPGRKKKAKTNGES